jgi:addiction module HigA family antidote
MIETNDDNFPAIHPGVLLKGMLVELGIGQIILAIDTGISAKHISSMIKGKAGISADTAILLEKYLPPHTAEYWLELDYKWRLAEVRNKSA